MQIEEVQARSKSRDRAAATILIDGKWFAARSGQTYPSLNPGTEEVIGYVSESGAEDVDAAVKAARKSFEDKRWRNLPTTERARIMFSIADRLEAGIEELARNEAIEVGMPLWVARWSIKHAINAYRYFGGWITKIHGQTVEIAAGAEQFHCYTRKEPMGVAALILPFNGPLFMGSHKIAPALASGCSMVIKPSEDTSLNTMALVRIIHEAGVPPGVLNMVTGHGPGAGAALVAHPDVDKVSFTGSSATGKVIARAAVDNLKRVSLELGGKNPTIVLDDADLDMAIEGIVPGFSINSGQGCACGTRLYVQSGIYDKLMQRLTDSVSKLVVGNQLDPDTNLGPLVSQKQFARVMNYIDIGVSDGGELLFGGKRQGNIGYFVQPTIFQNVPSTSRAMREEIFGPVIAATRFDDIDSVIKAANDTRFGLGGSVYTSSLKHAHRFAMEVRCATFWINTHQMTDYALPFGGYKESGWGREQGLQGVESFMEDKSVIARLY